MTRQLMEKIDEYKRLESRMRHQLRMIQRRRQRLEEALRYLDEPVDVASILPEVGADDTDSVDITVPEGPNLKPSDFGPMTPEMIERASGKRSPGRPPGRRFDPLRGSLLEYLQVAMDLAVMNAKRRVHVSDVAREIKALHLSNAKVGSLSATIQKGMSASPIWEKVDHGVFQLASHVANETTEDADLTHVPG